MHPHRFDQLFKRASRGSAAPGSQFVGHAEYGVLATSSSYESNFPRCPGNLWRNSYGRALAQTWGRNSVALSANEDALASSCGISARVRGWRAGARATCSLLPVNLTCYGARALRPRESTAWEPNSLECKYWASQVKCACSQPPAGSNHSLKLSTNGMPPGPGRRYAVHFHRPGPGVMPLAPA